MLVLPTFDSEFARVAQSQLARTWLFAHALYYSHYMYAQGTYASVSRGEPPENSSMMTQRILSAK